MLSGQKEERSRRSRDGPLRFSRTDFCSLWTKCLWLSPVVGEYVFEFDFQWIRIGFWGLWMLVLVFRLWKRSFSSVSGKRCGFKEWKSIWRDWMESSGTFLFWMKWRSHSWIGISFLLEKDSIYKDTTETVILKKLNICLEVWRNLGNWYHWTRRCMFIFWESWHISWLIKTDYSCETDWPSYSYRNVQHINNNSPWNFYKNIS